MSIIGTDYVCALDGRCYHAVNGYCQVRDPRQCEYSRKRSLSINEYFNQMAVEDKADFFADVMACEACPKKDGCMKRYRRKHDTVLPQKEHPAVGWTAGCSFWGNIFLERSRYLEK